MVVINNIECYDDDSEIIDILKDIPMDEGSTNTALTDLDRSDPNLDVCLIFKHDRKLYVVYKNVAENDMGLSLFICDPIFINNLIARISEWREREPTHYLIQDLLMRLEQIKNELFPKS